MPTSSAGVLRAMPALALLGVVGGGCKAKSDPCNAMTLPSAIVQQSALIRVDLYDPSVACVGNSASPNGQPPLLSRSFVPDSHLVLTAPPGRYTVVLTAFADAKATLPLGGGCQSGDFSPGAAVCLSLAVDAYDLGTPSDDGGAPTIALVHAVAPGYVRTKQQSISVSETSGDLLVAAVYWTNSAATVSIADTLSNRWTSTPEQNNATCSAEVQIWYAEGVAGGSNTVTVTQSMGTNPLGFYLLEYSGIARSGSFDSSAGQTAPAASHAMSTGALPTHGALDLVVALFNDPNGNGQMSPGPPFLKEGSDFGFYTMVEDLPKGLPPGVYTTTANLPVDDAGVRSDACWAATAASFKAQ